jgi:protein Tob/BTG
MNVEIQVALNFLISFLYNKLPRRRVNNFGEELEAALRVKFEGHWYPEKPFKGSAYRCLKTTPPLDPVFGIAAREAGMDLCDIQENLPSELSIWVDPGEVSYRMSEKGPVKILYSDSDRIHDQENPEREVIRTFNPEAQCFKPVELMTNHMSSLSIAPGVKSHMSLPAVSPAVSHMPFPVPAAPTFKAPVTSMSGGFGPKQSSNVTLTAGMFAQTKFGSTKLKNSGKRSQRMSPTEFGNYIKQKALIQQQQQQHQAAVASHHNPFCVSPQNSRSISPESPGFDSFMFMPNMTSNSQSPSPPSGNTNTLLGGGYGDFMSRKSLTCNSIFDSGNMDDLFGPFTPLESDGPSSLSRYSSLEKPFASPPGSSVLGSSPESVSETRANAAIGSQSSLGSNSSSGSRTFDNVSYPNQYQHLLVAN